MKHVLMMAVVFSLAFIDPATASTRKFDVYERGQKVQTYRCNATKCDVYEKGQKVRTIREKR